jgi:hypothetical protein
MAEARHWPLEVRRCQVAEKPSNLNLELRTANFKPQNLAIFRHALSLKF